MARPCPPEVVLCELLEQDVFTQLNMAEAHSNVAEAVKYRYKAVKGKALVGRKQSSARLY